MPANRILSLRTQGLIKGIPVYYAILYYFEIQLIRHAMLRVTLVPKF